MKEFLTKSQQIKVTCIVRHNNKILLLRSTQVANPEHEPRGGYFDIPTFTVSFGEDPRVTLLRTLNEYLGQSVDTVAMLDVRQYLSSNDTIQIFEMLFAANTIANVQLNEELGKFMFVSEEELDAYMFPQESIHLKKYL